jgi:hypothetical protein
MIDSIRKDNAFPGEETYIRLVHPNYLFNIYLNDYFTFSCFIGSGKHHNYFASGPKRSSRLYAE